MNHSQYLEQVCGANKELWEAYTSNPLFRHTVDRGFTLREEAISVLRQYAIEATRHSTQLSESLTEMHKNASVTTFMVLNKETK